MRPLADYLHAQGMTCLVVRLPGHATSPEDLSHRRWEEWLAAVETGYDKLAAWHSRIYGIGMSTGCLVLLALALKKKLDGLVLCSPYLAIQHRLAGQAWWLRYFRPYYPSPGSNAERDGYYSKRPVAGVHQINRLIRHLESNLKKITVPVLAMNGEGDQTVDIESGRRIYEELGSRPKIYLRFGPETPHVLIREGNPHFKYIFRLTSIFINELHNPGSDK
jgi:carboxylesterase